jgi:hypothetical protein
MQVIALIWLFCYAIVRFVPSFNAKCFDIDFNFECRAIFENRKIHENVKDVSRESFQLLKCMLFNFEKNWVNLHNCAHNFKDIF